MAKDVKKDDTKKKSEPVVGQASEAPAEDTRAPRFHVLRGFKDILPSEQLHWERIRTLAADLASAYGYERIDTPILEDFGLFRRAVGAATDIVEHELFTFTEQGGDTVALRPEGTAAVVRAYIEHGMLNQPQPVKFWYLGPMFRYDRPQAGRFRQFHQIGLEVFGEMHPATDAELLLLATNFYRALGIPIIVQVNSIGCRICRPAYVEELTTFCKANRTQVCEACKLRMQRAPLRVLDCKEPGCRQIYESAPQVIDWLCEECKQHFIRVLEYLDELEVPYALSPFLVRGLDYYTKTVFEIVPAAVGGDGPAPAQSTLAAGGRYDALVEELGGRPTPGTGIAIGIERTILRWKEAIAAGTAAAPVVRAPEVYLAQLGDQAKRKAMRLFEMMRTDGIAVAAHFAKDALKAQLEHANRLGARLTLILGQKEVMDETIIVREMSSGVQEIIAFEKTIPEVRKRLAQETVIATQTTPTADVPTDAVPVERSPAPVADDELADDGASGEGAPPAEEASPGEEGEKFA